jgi:hypothetical protein
MNVWNVYEMYMKCMDHGSPWSFPKVTQGSPLGLRQITGAEGERRIPKVEMWKPTWVGPQKIRQVWGTYLEPDLMDLMADLLICWANSSQQANHHDQI